MINPVRLALENNTYGAGLPPMPWEEALKQTSKLLEEKGFVSGAYVEKIIADSEALSFYYLVGPNIAMPHARPEYGVYKTGLAITSWPEGIFFSQHDFNPVRCIFMISVLEDDDHIDFIMKMAGILQNRPFIEAVGNCRQTENITALLKSYLSTD